MERFLLPILTGFVLLLLLSTSVSARDPIKIGFSMALTGGLAGGGKQALVGMELWADDINAKGGILGRPVQLMYYDDQTKASTVPGIYAKLLDVDKVDFVVSGYGTNLIAPAMPIVKQRDIVFMGLFGMDNNKKWKHDKYFQILPSGPNPVVDFSRAWFESIMQLNPKPKSIAFVAADAEFARNLKEGAVTNARALGLKITYNKNYKPGTPDFTPIMRAINATNPDVIYVAAYPPGAAGITRAVSEVGTKAVAFGGGMVGLQFSGIMKGLGPKLNGILNYDFYVPEPNMNLYPGVADLLKRYQKKAPERKVDPKGWYLAPWSYAYLQILGDAVNAVGKIDHAAIAKYIHATEFSTVVGKVRFGKNGEWLKGRTLTVQWQNIKKEGDLEQFAQPGIRKIMAPAAFATGKVQPFNSLRGEFALAAGRAKENSRENGKPKYANKNSSSNEVKLRLLTLNRLEKTGLITKEEAAGKRKELLDLSSPEGKPSPTVTAKKTPKVNPAPAKPDITPAQGRDTTPPTIQIASSIAVKEDSPTIRGRVDDDNKVVQVSVNGVATSFSGQTFSFNRYVPPSGTKVTIEAVDEWGNKSTKVVRLTRKKVETVTRRFDPLDPTRFSARRNPNAVALIIGITKYKRTVEAKFAEKDAQFFSDYARRKLGVPQSNIKVLTNEKAGSTDIFEAAANWLPSATQAGKSDVYIFYAGHGLSSADGKEVYLIPYNGSPTLLEQTALHRTKLFKSIADARPRSVTVFLDTCYSGTARTNEILVASRGIRVVPRELEIPTRFTVFSAASMTQTAQILDETGHGLFSYWLMKGMEGGADKNKDRKITAGELHDYVRSNVTRLRRDQTPQLKGNKETVLMRW